MDRVRYSLPGSGMGLLRDSPGDFGVAVVGKDCSVDIGVAICCVDSKGETDGIVKRSLLPKKNADMEQQTQMMHQMKKRMAWIWRKRDEVRVRGSAG